VGYTADWVPDVRSGGRYTAEHASLREARALLAELGRGGRVVALDSRGDELSSRELSGRLEDWATPLLTLIVGGPAGLHREVLDRADRVWSLSRLTLAHEWVRALVAEQLYRAMSILRRTPYHR
jgi:23S rRNA (pseudouridine1915-N3)-methyltransferase